METTLITLALAFTLGMFINELLTRIQAVYGVLRIDHSNTDKDLYRLEIDDIDILSKRRFVILKVENDADLSQK